MKWHTVKVTDHTPADFEKPDPTIDGILEGTPIKIIFDQEKHRNFYKPDADNIGVKGDLIDGVIKADEIRSYIMRTVTVTVGGISEKGKDNKRSIQITGYDNEDVNTESGRSQRYFLLVKGDNLKKLDEREGSLENGAMLSAKGYVLESQKGDRSMSVLGMKVVKTKAQAQEEKKNQKQTQNQEM